jgi:hypothetical protein
MLRKNIPPAHHDRAKGDIPTQNKNDIGVRDRERKQTHTHTRV